MSTHIQVSEAGAPTPAMGTKFMMENEYCSAWDFRVPGGAGEPGDMHQHIVDHCFVILDLPAKLNVYVPETADDVPGPDGIVKNFRYLCDLDCTDLATCYRYYGEPGDGGFVDGKPQFGPAGMHVHLHACMRACVYACCVHRCVRVHAHECTHARTGLCVPECKPMHDCIIQCTV